MKTKTLLKRAAFALILTFLFSPVFSQIRIENYRAKEQSNWMRESRSAAKQIQTFKSQIVNNNEVLFDIDILMNVEAKSFVAVYNIRQVAEDAVKVNELMDNRLNAFIKDLGTKGISRSDITIDLISQTPIYGIEKSRKLFSKSSNEVPIGFEMEKNLIIQYRKYEDINWIASMAAGHEIYDLVKVDFFAKNPKLYLDTMRHAGLQYLKQAVKEMKNVGIELDTLKRTISEKNGAIYPITRYQKYNPLGKPAYGSLLKGTEATSVETIPSPSLYYNHFAFANYDIVLHSEITKPVIQYTMNIKVKYMDYPKPGKTVKQIYYLTPDGRMQLLDVKQ